jgi:hypothetical protein
MMADMDRWCAKTQLLDVLSGTSQHAIARVSTLRVLDEKKVDLEK